MDGTLDAAVEVYCPSSSGKKMIKAFIRDWADMLPLWKQR
jgi:hypothetical protein